jgi:hypothetical protein
MDAMKIRTFSYPSYSAGSSPSAVTARRESADPEDRDRRRSTRHDGLTLSEDAQRLQGARDILEGVLDEVESRVEALGARDLRSRRPPRIAMLEAPDPTAIGSRVAVAVCGYLLGSFLSARPAATPDDLRVLWAAVRAGVDAGLGDV